MLWVNIKRIAKAGFINFWRNGFVSLSAVLMMMVTLFVIGTTIFTSALLTQSLEVVREKVDVNVYFTTEATEEEVLEVKKSIETLPEVDYVEYISKEQVLVNFEEANRDNQNMIDALAELDENPFGPTLNIKAKETSQYQGVATFLDQNYLEQGDNSIIEKVNYLENKLVIEKLVTVIDAGERLGAFIGIIFIIISIIITLNTIRLAMYISRDEIKVMKLVGASSTYITLPFVVEGAMYGIVAAIFTLVLFYPVTYWLAPYTSEFFGTMSVYEYYLSSFWEIFLIILFSGILIGSISSFLAIKKYLKS